jgi:glycosyltransferase involved in cell wall biosynthesis
MEMKPRVLHVVDSLEIGGMERLVHDLAIARGAETTSVACLVSVGSFGEALRNQGIKVELIGTKGGFIPTVWRMSRHLRRVRADLLHCHSLYSFLNGSTAARLAGNIPAVVTKHGASVPGNGPGSRMNRLLIRHADVVAVSREAMDVVKAWTRNSRSLCYIPNGLSLRPYENLPSRRSARMRLGLPESSFIIGVVARVTRTKGHRLLLDVFARLQSRMPNALLLIVGDGAELPAVKAHIRKLALENSVQVMGERQDVPAILAALDVFCLPSETEGMPMTVLEAMAAGLPVLASNVGGIPELLEQGRAGLMVPPRAPDELEAALLTLANDPVRARDMGRAGRERLLKEFSLECTLNAYEDLYRQAIARPKPKRSIHSSRSDSTAFVHEIPFC